MGHPKHLPYYIKNVKRTPFGGLSQKVTNFFGGFTVSTVYMTVPG